MQPHCRFSPNQIRLPDHLLLEVDAGNRSRSASGKSKQGRLDLLLKRRQTPQRPDSRARLPTGTRHLSREEATVHLRTRHPLEMEGGFKSPRPPAPRVRSRGPSMSRNAANRAGQTQEQQHPLPGTEQDQDSLFGVGATSISNADTGDLPSSSFPRDGLSSASVLARLESLLVAKSNEIQLAGRLGEALLTQQAELESKIRELEEEVQGETRSGGARAGAGAAAGVVSGGGETSEDEVSNAISEEVKQKLQALEAELKSWQKGNNEIYKIIGLSNGDRDAPPSSSHGIAKQPSAASMVSTDAPGPLCTDHGAGA